MYLFIDYENVHDVGYDLFCKFTRVFFFVGAKQPKLPVEMVISIQPLGSKITWVKVPVTAPNALDFYIAARLGHLFYTGSKVPCLILSKDTGFDPIISTFSEGGMQCNRVVSLDAFRAKAKK